MFTVKQKFQFTRNFNFKPFITNKTKLKTNQLLKGVEQSSSYNKCCILASQNLTQESKYK